jgi:hypothetical protein
LLGEEVKKKINIRAPKMLIQWVVNQYFLYGDNILLWWEEQGCKNFFDWAEKKKIDFIKLTEEKNEGNLSKNRQ